VSFAATTLCVASQRGFIVVKLSRYRLSPETFGYTLEHEMMWLATFAGKFLLAWLLDV
jgi:hypothetical protein